MTTRPEYQPQTADETLCLIADGVDPWVAVGQFLDDWWRTAPAARCDLIREAPSNVPSEQLRWAALLAGAVEWLCATDGLACPAWTRRPEYQLAEPWFLYPGWRLRAWQLVDTPAAFKSRNIFGGDRILSRA